MYVAFQSIAPETDIGYDLSKEYAAAKSLHTDRASHGCTRPLYQNIES
jgi:hypothetical protein